MKTSVLALAFFAAASQALVPLQRGRKAIPSQYVVLLKEGADLSSHYAALSSFMASDNPANELLHKYAFEGYHGYAIRCSREVLQFIREKGEAVHLVEEDQFMSVFDVQANPPSWGLDRVDQRSLPVDSRYNYPSSAGAGVNAYTIDTGIRITHNDFEDRAEWGYTANANASDDDLNGHGTHVSGTIAGSSYGIAKEANLIAVKVLGDLGFGSTSDVIAGVNWVASQHSSGDKSVANMSLGGGAATTLDAAVNSAVNAGIHIAVAAGNDNADACNYSPARAESAVTVGATDSSDAKASYSNYGTCVDLHAPGTAITSAWITTDSSSRTISGTSMASPHVAGVMALYLAEGLTPSEANLVSASTKNTITGLPSSTVNYLLYTSSSLTEAQSSSSKETPSKEKPSKGNPSKENSSSKGPSKPFKPFMGLKDPKAF